MTSRLAIEIFIIVLFATPIYAFAIYPILLSVLSKFLRRNVNSSTDYKPEISIVIAAYNEEEYIEAAVDSIYLSNYPTEKISVYVGSDGSDDGTLTILESLSKKYPNFYYYDLPRGGKNQLLNTIAPKTSGELVFFLDADCRILPDTLIKVVAQFADEEVGAALSQLKIIENSPDDNTGRLGETFYQKYETFLRINESRLWGQINGLGTLYGIRRKDYVPLPNEFVCDDLFNMLHTALIGKRAIFTEGAVTYEIRNKSLAFELFRRERLVSGGISTILACKKLLLPSAGWSAFFVWSHKILRWLSPIILILLGLCTVLLPPESPVWLPVASLQGIFYTFAAIGWFLEKYEIKFLPFRLALFLISMNIGFLMGIIRFFRRKQNSRWNREGLSV